MSQNTFLIIATIIIGYCAFSSLFICRNPVYSVLNLVVIFIMTSILWISILSLDFLGLTYLIVYVGAIAILFLFIIMMLNINKLEVVSTDSRSKTSTNGGLYPTVIVLFLIVTTLFLITYDIFGNNDATSTIYYSVAPSLGPLLTNTFTNNFNITVTPLTNVQIIGYFLYSNYAFGSIILISLVLLMVMIGVIILTLHNRKFTINE